jgi:hypothetical protein
LQVLSNKFDSFTGKWKQKNDIVHKLLIDMQQDIMQVDDRLVQLDLDVEQVHQFIVDKDKE